MNQMIARLGYLLLLLTATNAADAQVSFSSLEEIWKYADTHNVSIRNSGFELDKVLYAKKQSYMALLPQVSATGSFTDNTALQTTLLPGPIFGRPSGTYEPVQFGQKYIYAGGFSAQLDIVNLQTWFNMRIVTETEQADRASLGNSRKLAYQQIASQYYAYVLNKEAYKLSVTSASVADSVFQSVSNKFNQGVVSMANVDVARLNKERAEQTLISAQYQMQTARNTLKGLLNLSVKDSLNVETSLQSNLEKNAAGSFSEDPAIRLAEWQSRLSLTTFKASQGNFAPTLSLIYSNSTQQNDNKFEPFQGGAAWYPAQYWSLRASWTLFTGGQRWVVAQKNKINYYESQLQLENIQKQSAISDENLRLSYARAAAMLEKAEDVLNLSFDNFTHVSNRYNSGMASVEDRLSAFRDYLDYQNQYLNTLSDLLIQLYQIKIRQQTF